ncbi:MAG: 4-hydroxy-tetrahydrodipicolinate reductase [Candidatus Omnitrophota bacterium]|nr:MAG: 4-hydroxy-tetrahydrodipicolinate reductase [Candidatus Omnitrophota bacterium]
MVEKIRVIVNGSKGKMGLETIKAIRNTDDIDLVGETDLGDDLQKEIIEKNAEVVIDFTSPACVYKNIRTIMESKAGGVIGTTGLNNEQIGEIKKQGENKTPGIIIAPNFAIGALLLMKFAQQAAKYIQNVEIIELHHEKKLDSPSGTAIKTAELIHDSTGCSENVPRGTNEPARGQNIKCIPIHSIRLPGLLAHQEVIFGTTGQTLTIRHDSLDRSCFMPGVLIAVREAMNQTGVIYGLENILFDD